MKQWIQVTLILALPFIRPAVGWCGPAYDWKEGFDQLMKQGYSQEAWELVAANGDDLSAAEAARLEKELKKNPSDLFARVQLISYWNMKGFQDPKARKAHQEAVLWLIQNKPGDPASGGSYLYLFPVLDGEEFKKAKALWLKATNAHPNDVQTLWNAAVFLEAAGEPEVEGLLKKGKTLEPGKKRWPERLGHHYLNQGTLQKRGEVVCAKALVEFEEAAAGKPPDTALDDLARASFCAGDLVKARRYASQELETKGPNDSWNEGNRINHGHVILGRVDLREGNLKGAKDHLAAAGKTKGSPQLNSFGPDFSLASELLEKGAKKEVLSYLEDCRKFWTMGGKRLDEWTADIKAGRTPKFKKY